ncbi:co-chaperone GroES [Ligilactobacillus ceti]|uniref:Co-chaperonin GroES n=1 Tax=Ligilactobacillus ceti DSM 22408 TaxID=1122146 RepID=A0A0R2KGM8_9LACO|nr:co-chaperone GroES [Ligilactobacillus ceti]KRN88427.1 hypothetical protein IV53_GL000391 [Ligilactobacillus ceti DSM 22408]
MLRPLGERVIIQVKKEQEQTVGSLVLAGPTEEQPTKGTVVAISADIKADVLKENDVVVFDKFAGSTVQYQGQDYLILQLKDILAVVE